MNKMEVVSIGLAVIAGAGALLIVFSYDGWLRLFPVRERIGIVLLVVGFMGAVIINLW